MPELDLHQRQTQRVSMVRQEILQRRFHARPEGRFWRSAQGDLLSVVQDTLYGYPFWSISLLHASWPYIRPSLQLPLSDTDIDLYERDLLLPASTRPYSVLVVRFFQRSGVWSKDLSFVLHQLGTFERLKSQLHLALLQDLPAGRWIWTVSQDFIRCETQSYPIPNLRDQFFQPLLSHMPNPTQTTAMVSVLDDLHFQIPSSAHERMRLHTTLSENV